MSDTTHLIPVPQSLKEVGRMARDPFLVEGLVHSSVTAFFGVPKSGKSSVVVNLTHAALAGGDFLGVPFGRGVRRVHVFVTDADGPGEYHDRLLELGIAEDEERVTFWKLDMLSASYVDAIAASGTADIGPDDLVILDHATALEDDGNRANEVSRFFGALERLRKTAPLVLVAHASTSGVQGSNRHKILGSTAWAARIRWQVEVTRKGDTLTLACSGNAAKPVEFVAEVRDSAADMHLISRSDSDELTERRGKRRRDRDLETVRQVEEWAEFVEDECRGMTKKDTAQALHEKWSGTAVSTFVTYLKPAEKIGVTLARRAEAAA